jgi:regulator of extracellular matrix RemA (YlzA/DUF370 family)
MVQQSAQSQLGAELIHAGFGNFIAMNRVVAIATPGSAPIQRLIRDAKKKGSVIDQTSGRRTKSAVFTDTGQVILLAITPEAVAGRVGSTRLSRPVQAE